MFDIVRAQNNFGLGILADDGDIGGSINGLDVNDVKLLFIQNLNNLGGKGLGIKTVNLIGAAGQQASQGSGRFDGRVRINSFITCSFNIIIWDRAAFARMFRGFQRQHFNAVP